MTIAGLTNEEDPERQAAKGGDAPVDKSALDGFRYVARQPILDLRGHVHGYELLFRAGPASLAFSDDGDAATQTQRLHAMPRATVKAGAWWRLATGSRWAAAAVRRTRGRRGATVRASAGAA